MFEIFGQLGIAHVEFTQVGRFSNDDWIVVYIDEYAHCGEGKLLIRAGDAKRLSTGLASGILASGISQVDSHDMERILKDAPKIGAPESFENLSRFNASRYISEARGETYRYLFCGGHGVWFKNVSFSDWRSNAGDGDLYPVAQEECSSVSLDFVKAIKNPLWAIDFIRIGKGREAKFLAVDFNTAPRVSGTPLKKVVSSELLANGVIRMLQEVGAADKFDNNFVVIA